MVWGSVRTKIAVVLDLFPIHCAGALTSPEFCDPEGSCGADQTASIPSILTGHLYTTAFGIKLLAFSERVRVKGFYGIPKTKKEGGQIERFNERI
jgi:hypothetical protein